jgi:hypothetical protein
MTVQDSLAARTFVEHATPKTLAKQWLQLYRRGPYWVVPIVVSSTISNAYLAWASAGSPDPAQRNACIAAALTVWSILPITFLYFEPGINGACKWKVQSLLASEGFSMPKFNGIPSSLRHSATPATKVWAEKLSMKELVTMWERRNHGRWVVSLLAAGLSGYATLCL